MYPSMTVNWHEIIKTKINSTDVESLPVFMAVFSSSKGPECLTDLINDDFVDLYGQQAQADFFKYGQPLMQAHTILKAGARILGYRLCADDATLANAIICAEVTEEEDTRELGTSTSPDGTVGEGEIELFSFAKIKYSIKTVEGCKTIEEVVEQANAMASETCYPLFVICDNGRGTSVKKFRIVPDYSASRTLSYMIYTLMEIENNTDNEPTKFSINTDALYTSRGNTRSMNLIPGSSTQLGTVCMYDQMQLFAQKVADISGYAAEELINNDLLFGMTRKKVALENIVIDDTGVNLNHTFGIDLLSGSNGEFGDTPFAGETCSEAWAKKAAQFFHGDLTDLIWDRDLYKIDFICDANYPDIVKDQIGFFAMWHKECYYLRDLGLDIWTVNDAVNKVAPDEWRKSSFIGDYASTYEIIDPASKKQVRVTMVHGIAPILVKYYAENLAAPLAGEFNNFVITEAIDGTLNFSPRVTPFYDTKQIMDDNKINYCGMQRNPNRLVVQSLFTSQDHKGPLQYASNVIITQMAIKAVRAYVPKIRFMLQDDYDFSKYKQLIDDNVLSAYQKYFSSIELIYTQNNDESEEGIFHGSIECYYKKFVKSEIFDVFAIDGTPDDDESSYVSDTIDVV